MDAKKYKINFRPKLNTAKDFINSGKNILEICLEI
jgi:hypothetical protein